MSPAFRRHRAALRWRKNRINAGLGTSYNVAKLLLACVSKFNYRMSNALALEKTYRSGANHALRVRCQMILLKSEGRKSQEIADFLGYCQQAVNNWLHRYKAGGIEALATTSGGGRSPILSSESDLAAVRLAVQKCRQRISVAKAKLEETLAKRFCERTLSRFLKNLMPVTNASEGDLKKWKTRTFTN